MLSTHDNLSPGVIKKLENDVYGELDFDPAAYLHLYLAVQHIHDRVGVMTVNGVYGLADPAYYTLLVADAAYSY